MFDFFNQALGFFETIFNFFLNVLDTGVRLIELVLKAFVVPSELIGILPSFIGVSLSIVLAVSIVKFIFGR